MATPPPLILQAFRANEPIELVAVLLIDDGFEATTMRVLAAFLNSSHEWRQPKKPIPDEGRPTARVWEWLWSGYVGDLAAVARGSGVSLELASEKLDLLKHNHLVYPDGNIAQTARAALAAHSARALGAKPEKRPRSSATPPKGPGPGEN